MGNYLLGGLSSVQALLFSGSDHLDLGQVVDETAIGVSSSGVVTTLGINGTTVSLPTLALSTAGQNGNVTFADGTHLITGSSNNESMHGTSTDDAAYGLDGNDSIYAGDGNDMIFGGAGSDTLLGGSGNDHIYGLGPAAGMDGNDSILGGDGSDYMQGNGGNDTLDGGSGSDRMLGGQGDDQMTGGIGNDNLNGNIGNDRLDGGAGEDLLRGGKGDDVVVGGDGNDTIMGDLGADTLTGGQGSDLFQFHGTDAAALSTDMVLGHIDTITDFTLGQDHLSLGFVPAAIHDGSAGSIAGALTWAVTALTGHGGDVAAVTVGHDTYLFYSSAGGAIADSVIDLQGVSSLNAGAFV